MLKKLSSFAKKNRIFLLILSLGLFFRLFRIIEFLPHGHDQDLAGWIIKDIVNNGHIRLIGQETSTKGVFIGGAFYYLLLPFYLVFGGSPLGGVVLVSLISAFSIWSIYFVFKNLLGERTGLIAAFIYAVSPIVWLNDRQVVPTVTIMLWSIWYIYSLTALLKGEGKKAFILLGVLAGLIWHINFSLFLFFFLLPFALYFSRKKINRNSLLFGAGAFLVSNIPLLFFELRHNFSQTRAIFASFLTGQGAASEGWDRFYRTFFIFSRNATNFLWGELPGLSLFLAPFVLGLMTLYIVKNKKKEIKIVSLFLLANAIYLLFFSLYSKNLSEYYLNPLVITWIGILAFFLESLWKKKKTIFIIFSLSFLLLSLFWLFHQKGNGQTFIEKKSLIAEIKKDAEKREFPCVAVSYMTGPGDNFGYRYLFWQEKMHVNKPSTGSPVYTIVFPHSLANRLDKTFGGLGLIYPEYEKYDEKSLEISCSGDNQNVVDSMLLYTE